MHWIEILTWIVCYIGVRPSESLASMDSSICKIVAISRCNKIGCHLGGGTLVYELKDDYHGPVDRTLTKEEFTKYGKPHTVRK